MDEQDGSLSEWAREELSFAVLGDVRRRKRAIRMLESLARFPSGSVLGVFGTSAERQGAYDLLENVEVRAEALLHSIAGATAERAASGRYAFVPVDGSSLSLTDRSGAKDFGAVGSNHRPTRGLKVMTAYAVSPDGVPLGVTAQVWWARVPRKRRHDHQTRKLEEKETRYWIDAIEQTVATFRKTSPDTTPWFQLDREGDGAHVLSALVASGAQFTVRSSHNRRLESPKERPKYLREQVGKAPVCGDYMLAVRAGVGRKKRVARMRVRVRNITLRVEDKATNKTWPITLTAISTKESGTTPRGEAPLQWTLLTNAEVNGLEDAKRVIYGYTQRWRIEEFHKTWKSGACNVERSQLRQKSNVVKWATLMAAVAARIERLKTLARTESERPASLELTPYEIMALVLTRRRTKKRTDPMPEDNPSIGDAVRWLADIGGYTGPKVSGGPPGSITIKRGLDRIIPVALALEQLEKEGKLR